jgi:hypothetical protein
MIQPETKNPPRFGVQGKEDFALVDGMINGKMKRSSASANGETANSEQDRLGRQKRTKAGEVISQVKKIWIDIENPPQVQYLVPFRDFYREQGMNVIVTARDSGVTFDLLRKRGIPFEPVYRDYGKSLLRKLVGLLVRTYHLYRVIAKERPAVSLSSSRSAAIVSRLVGIRSFVFIDYEHAEMRIYRLCGSYILYPKLIPKSSFTKIGFGEEKLIPFQGLKEAITFSLIDFGEHKPLDFGRNDTSLVVVLLRPPGEEGYYFNKQSKDILIGLLDYLSRRTDAVVLYSPRYRWQAALLEAYSWANKPMVLDQGVHFVSLLKSCDIVISSGGTMLREAAYVGIPAYSIFKSARGEVDRYLNRTGLLEFLESANDFSKIVFSKRKSELSCGKSSIVEEIGKRVIQS